MTSSGHSKAGKFRAPPKTDVFMGEEGPAGKTLKAMMTKRSSEY